MKFESDPNCWQSSPLIARCYELTSLKLGLALRIVMLESRPEARTAYASGDTRRIASRTALYSDSA